MGPIKCGSEVLSIAFSPDGSCLATAALSGVLALWRYPLLHQESILAIGDTARVVTFDRSGRYLIVGTVWDRTVQVWDTRRWKRLRRFCGHQQEVTALAVAADGNTIASGATDGLLFLWNIRSRKRSLLYDAGREFIDALNFAPSGEMLAAAIDGHLFLWRLHQDRWALERKIPIGRGAIYALVFSPDGRTLAVSHRYETARILLWDTVQWHLKHALLPLQNGAIFGLAFSPSGRLLASGGSDAAVRLWETETGRDLVTFTGHSKSCVAVAFHPTKRILASGSNDKTVRFWDFS